VTNSGVSDRVGAKVREHRQRLGLTREQLADRCTELGANNITASVLVNIETGRPDKTTGARRRDITVDEVLVLAYALDVPPVVLFVEPDNQTPLPITPKTQVSGWDALYWVTGEEQPPWLQDDEATSQERHQHWQAAAGALIESRAVKTYVKRLRNLQARGDKATYMDLLRDMARASDILAMSGKSVPIVEEQHLNTMLEQGWLEHPDEVVAAWKAKHTHGQG
jgi:transcriptional regulator with XRE-family HTH domain